jgi:hypothetical protein
MKGNPVIDTIQVANQVDHEGRGKSFTVNVVLSPSFSGDTACSDKYRVSPDINQ